MSLYVKLSMQEIADGLTAIGWSGAGGGGDASLSYGSTAPLAPTNGTLWYDTTEEILKLFRVDAWVNISVTQSVINNINAQVTLAQSYAQDAQEALSGFTSIVATATTLAPESSATATFNASTGVLTLGIPKGATGADGISGAQLNIANTFTAPQRTATIAQTNAINFTLKNNFTINATVGIISASNLTGCSGQGGVIVIESAENITGWSAEFVFKDIPTDLNGLEVFSYFVQTETVIRIGRVS